MLRLSNNSTKGNCQSLKDSSPHILRQSNGYYPSDQVKSNANDCTFGTSPFLTFDTFARCYLTNEILFA